jgi:hypothetical protein
LLRALEAHATGSVRLQVTGSPPTTNGSPFSIPPELFPHESVLKGKAAAMSPCTTCLRLKACSSTMSRRLRRRNMIGSATRKKQSSGDRFWLSCRSRPPATPERSWDLGGLRPQEFFVGRQVSHHACNGLLRGEQRGGDVRVIHTRHAPGVGARSDAHAFKYRLPAGAAE